MQWRKWRNWRKIASLWWFELDAKSGSLEAGDFGKMAILAKISRGLAIIPINVPDPWRLAILAKMAIVAKLAILAKIARNACNGENGKKLPASGDLNWMPKVRIHCLLYFNLAFFFTNFAIFLKLCDQMRFEVNCAKSPHHAISDGLFLPSKPCSFPNTVNSLYDGHC